MKHFDANNEEFERHRIDEAIDVRALNEIYFPAFKAAVTTPATPGPSCRPTTRSTASGVPRTRSSSRTPFRTPGASGDSSSATGAGTYSTSGPINAGAWIPMPGGVPFHAWFAIPSTQQAGNSGGWLEQDEVLAAVVAGQVTQARVDDSVRRNAPGHFRGGAIRSPACAGRRSGHRAAAGRPRAAPPRKGWCCSRTAVGCCRWTSG